MVSSMQAKYEYLVAYARWCEPQDSERVPVFVPRCNRADDACGRQAFQQAIQEGTEPKFAR